MNVPEDKPLDQRYREAEQYTFDFGPASPPQPPKAELEAPQTCGKLGYCYCPKCHSR